MRSEARAETTVALLAIALAGWFLAEGSTLKPGVFEPIGPGAVPMGVAVVTIVLGAMVMVSRLRVWRRAGGGGEDRSGEGWALTLGVSALTIGYCVVLNLGLLRYGLVTAVYLALVIVGMAPQRRAALPWAVAIGLVTGFGLDHIFRHLLVADLP